MLIQIEKEHYDHILNLLGKAKVEIIRLRSQLDKDVVTTENPQAVIQSFESFLDGPSCGPTNPNMSTIDSKIKNLLKKNSNTNTTLEKVDESVMEKLGPFGQKDGDRCTINGVEYVWRFGRDICGYGRNAGWVRVVHPDTEQEYSERDGNESLKTFVKQQDDVIIKTNSDLPSIPMPNFDPLIFEGGKEDVAKEYNDPDTMEEIRKNYKHEGPITVVDEPDALAAAYNQLMAKLPQKDDDAMIHLKQKMSREEDVALEHAILKKQAKKEFWN